MGFSRSEWNELTHEVRDQDGRIIRVPAWLTPPRRPDDTAPVDIDEISLAPGGNPLQRTVTDDTQPGGSVQKIIEYEPPFDTCDREKDYDVVWAEFERRFQNHS